MTVFHKHAPSIMSNRRLPDGTHLAVDFSPRLLSQSGFILPVEVSTASEFRTSPLNLPLSSLVVVALFDTGATCTSIDLSLAKHLNLQVLGKSSIRTAAGRRIVPSFAVDIAFPSTKLLPFHSLKINSCDLGFDLQANSPLKAQNIGLLIGRDIMERWHIVWNGPTSTIIICD